MSDHKDWCQNCQDDLKREEAVRMADAALEFIPLGEEINFDEIENGFQADADMSEIMDIFDQ